MQGGEKGLTFRDVQDNRRDSLRQEGWDRAPSNIDQRRQSHDRRDPANPARRRPDWARGRTGLAFTTRRRLRGNERACCRQGDCVSRLTPLNEELQHCTVGILYLRPSRPLIAGGERAKESVSRSQFRPSPACFSSWTKPKPFPGGPAHPWRCSRVLAMPLRSWRVVKSGARNGGFWFHVGCSRSSSVLDGLFIVCGCSVALCCVSVFSLFCSVSLFLLQTVLSVYSVLLANDFGISKTGPVSIRDSSSSKEFACVTDNSVCNSGNYWFRGAPECR